jgi:hypothetical protein
MLDSTESQGKKESENWGINLLSQSQFSESYPFPNICLKRQFEQTGPASLIASSRLAGA